MMTFQIPVSYTQIVVFLSGLDRPFNNWTDRHVAQGFSWRSGSVSFRTFDDGDVDVSVLVGTVDPEPSTAERIIQVPFHIPWGASIEIGSVFHTVPVGIPPGEYALTFEHSHGTNGKMFCVLHFKSVHREVAAKIVRGDSELSPDRELLMIAEPA